MAILTLLLGLAQGGIDWNGRSNDPQEALAEAARGTKSVLIFFTAKDEEYAQTWNDVFSDPAVIDASKQIVCIRVDVTDPKNNDLCQRYGGIKHAFVKYCNNDGTDYGIILRPDPAGVAKFIKDDVAAGARERAAKQKEDARLAKEAALLRLPPLLMFLDASPPSVSVRAALNDASVKEILPRFGWSLQVFSMGSPEALKYGVDRVPTLLVLDPDREKADAKPLARIVGSRSARELRRDLEDALAAVAAATPAKSEQPGAVGASATSPPQPPKEELSDDEVDRRFIQARVKVALDLQKQGKKDKAIDVLEDIINTYPKHVDTQPLKKLLAELKKS
jgi:hypothetical protein